MFLKKLIEIIELCKEKEEDKAKRIINKFEPFLHNNLEASIINYSINSSENKKNRNCG